jgi:hypothetical protein
MRENGRSSQLQLSRCASNRLIMAYLSSAPLTKLPDENRKRLRCSRIAIVLRALTMAFGIAGLHSPCSAAGQSGAQHPSGLPEVLASVTVLSEAAMANETAAGVQAAPIVRDQSGLARILLWDELRVPQLPSGTNGAVTLNTGSGDK